MFFIQSILLQDTSQVGTYGSPLLHYLAVRGIDMTSQSLRDAFHYTPILAQILWVVRVLVLEMTISYRGWPKLKIPARDQCLCIPQRVQEMRRAHLTEGSYSPASGILGLLAMGKHYAKLHQAPANVQWSADDATIYYHGQGVVLALIHRMCQALTSELGGMLKELGFGELPVIDLGSVIDSTARAHRLRDTAYSFIHHPENKHLDVGWQFLYHRIRHDPQFRSRTVNQVFQMSERQTQQYKQREKRFLQKLLVLLHVTGGQPARGPEIGSIKVENSVYSARNLYVLNGRMCFLTTYDKASQRRGNIEYIIRYLPDMVSQILAQYLVYVRPFAQVYTRRDSEFLFSNDGEPWDGTELTRGLAEATQQWLGVRLTTSGWRHVAIGIAVRKLMHAAAVWKAHTASDGGEDLRVQEDDEDEDQHDMARHIMIR